MAVKDVQQSDNYQQAASGWDKFRSVLGSSLPNSINSLSNLSNRKMKGD